MDDLAALTDITGPTVLDTLSERFKHGQYYTYFGDFLLSINPCHDPQENEYQLGQWYRNSKPLQDLPPHVLAIAHRAYRMLLNDVTQQAILITGRSGSGKTEAARRVVSQLLREAKLSPVSGLGPQIIMAQHILTTLVTASTLSNPDTTRGIKMATLYFRPDGQMDSAELQTLCMDQWFLVDRGTGSGTFSIFYALLAGLSDQDIQRYYLVDKYRLLGRGDRSPVFSGEQDHHRHLKMFNFFMTALIKMNIDVQEDMSGLDIADIAHPAIKTRNFAGNEMSAVLSVLAAILHLGNLEVTEHAQSGQSVITNHHELRAACDLLAVRQELMEAELLSTTTFVNGEAVRVASTAGQALWNRDVMLVELYRRLVGVITTKINLALSGDSQYNYIDQGPQTAVTVVESPAQEADGTTLGLETFLRNMAAERIQYHLYEVTFQRDVETCAREHVKAYKIKYADNTELISAVFGPDYGIMNKVTAVTLDPQGSPAKLVSLMDNDRSLKKTSCYVIPGKNAKSPEAFFIKHAGLGQVAYSAGDFLSKNRSTLSQSARQMLLHSGNPVVRALGAVLPDETRYPPEMVSPDVSFATKTFQSDLSYLLQSLDNSNLHYIRCVKPNNSNAPGQFDPKAVTDQLKECSVVETARQRKFGYSACWTQEQFVRSYRDLRYSPFSIVPSLSEACKAILQKAGFWERGVTLSKTSLFLRYWQIQRLHALRAEQLRRIILAQALVRGFLTRRRLGGRMTSSQQRATIGRFMDNVAEVGNRAFRNVQAQAESDRHRFERQLRESLKLHQHPDDDWQNNGPYYDNGNSRGGQRRQDSGPYSSGYWDDAVSSVAPDDITGFYTRVVSKVLASLPTLDASTWVKIIYMERGRQVAKVYAEERSVIVDGSHAEYDGERLGLGMWRNPDRDEETACYRASIVEGLRLKRDTDGSISACRLCDQPIIVKGLQDPHGGDCFSADVLLCRGQLPLEKTIKIFDINEFRSKIALDLKQGCFSMAKMQRACVVGLSFGRDDVDDLQTPCWLCLVNVKALVALESDDIIREAQHHTAKLEMTSPEQEIQKLLADDAKSRRARERWARTDQREHLREKEAGERRLRQQLRAKGLPVGGHIRYSWDQSKGGEKTTADALHKQFGPEVQAGRPRGSGSVYEEIRFPADLPAADY